MKRTLRIFQTLQCLGISFGVQCALLGEEITGTCGVPSTIRLKTCTPAGNGGESQSILLEIHDKFSLGFALLHGNCARTRFSLCICLTQPIPMTSSNWWIPIRARLSTRALLWSTTRPGYAPPIQPWRTLLFGEFFSLLFAAPCYWIFIVFHPASHLRSHRVGGGG